MNRGLSFSRARHQKGFTIIELLTVIVVLSILVTITVFTYNGIQERAHDAAVQSDLQKIVANLETYYAKYGQYPAFSGATQMNDPSMRIGNAITRGSTDDKGLNPGQNVLYCRVTSTNTTGTPNRTASPQRFALITQSVSGNVYTYRSSNDTITEGSVWRNGNAAQTCSGVGIPQVNAADRDIFYFNHTWESYAQ